MTRVRFNPYVRWLGLEKPPNNYYELLRLPLWESDPVRIQAAARGALSTLRGVKPGRRQDRWKALLDQLETARDCLLDAQQKQRYDGRLRLKLRHEGRTPSEARPEEPPSIGAQAEIDPMAPVEFSQPPVPDQLLPHDGPPGDLRRDAVVISSKLLEIRDVPIAPRSAASRRLMSLRRRRRRQKPKSRGWAYAVVGLCAILVIGTFVFVMRTRVLPQRQLRQQSLAASPTSARDLPLEPEDGNAKAEPESPPGGPEEAGGLDVDPPLATSLRPNSNRSSVDDREGSTPVNLPPAGSAPIDVPPPGDSIPSEEADGSLAMSRVQPGTGPFPMPPTEMAEASPSALSRAIAPAEEARLDDLLRKVWAELRERRLVQARKSLTEAQSIAAGSSRAAEVTRLVALADRVDQFWEAFDKALPQVAGAELMLNSSRVFVVEAGPKQLIVRVLGQNRRFSPPNLPPGLVLAIADRELSNETATAQLLKGAYMAVTSPFTEAQVREVWQDAMAAGAVLDDLPQVLDDKPSE